MNRSEYQSILLELISFVRRAPEAPEDSGVASELTELDSSIQVTIGSSDVEKLQEYAVTTEQIIQAHGIWLNDYIQAFVEDPVNSDLSAEIITKLAATGITKISDIVDLSKDDYSATWKLFTTDEKTSLVQTWASFFGGDVPTQKISNDEFKELID